MNEYEIECEINGIDIVLMKDDQMVGAMARMKVDKNEKINLYRSQDECGFEAFGVEFQSCNRVETCV